MNSTRLLRHCSADLYLNAVTIMLAVSVLSVMLRNHYRNRESDAAHAPRPGSKIGLQNINWPADGATLIFVLQIGCPWCEASIPFYRSVIKQAPHSIHPLFVLPDAIEASRVFLESRDIHFVASRQASLEQMNVSGTPTLILVGPDGVIRKSWIGKLSAQQELDLLQSVGVEHPSMVTHNPASLRQIHPDDLARLINPPIVDVRPRTLFAERHIKGSLNIPLDELEARATHELPLSEHLVVYCDYEPQCKPATGKTPKVASYCELAERMLQDMGFNEILVLDDPLSRMKGVLTVEAPH